MKKIILFCLVGLMFFNNKSFCSDKDKFSIGLTGGMSQNKSFSGDLYLGTTLSLYSEKLKNLEVNTGYSFFSNKTSYRGINNLQFKSHGLFTEGNYYFTEGLYGGLRFAINFNWIDKESQKLFDNQPDIDSPTFFIGTAAYGHIGYYKPMGKNVGIKMQAQIGLHSHKVTQGWQIGTSDNPIREAQRGIENHIEFLYNLSIGIVFKL